MAVAYPNKVIKTHISANSFIWRYGRKDFMEYWFKNLPKMYKGKKNLVCWSRTTAENNKKMIFGEYGPKGPKFSSFHLYSHNTTFLLFFCYFGFLSHDYIIENTLLEKKVKNKLKELQNG